MLQRVKQLIQIHGNQEGAAADAGNNAIQNSTNVQGTTNVSSTTANNTQAGASNSTVTTDNIQETEIVESQTTTYEEGTDGRYLSWEIANVDTDRIGIASKINAKLDSVEVTKSAKTKTGGNFVTSGDEITYTISVENKEKNK